MFNTLLPLLVWGWFLFPAVIWGQTVEEQETEFISTTAAPAAASEDTSDFTDVAARIVRRTNQFRRDESRRKVTTDLELMKTAQYFADYMARTDEYGHRADGRGPMERARRHGYAPCLVSENIAYRYTSDPEGFTAKDLARGFFQGWKHSPGHRRNMLDPDVTETGVAVSHSDRTGHYYAVQMFGRPKAKMSQFQITNDTDTTVRYKLGNHTFPLPPRYSRMHERCRPAELIFHRPDEQESVTVHPHSGDQYTVVRNEGGKLVLHEG